MRMLIVACALLAGCASVGETALQAGTSGAVRFKAEDVDAAIRIAQGAKDTVAEGCFRALRGHLEEPPAPDVKGMVSAYALARTLARSARAGLADDVHVACAPLVVDAAKFQAQMAKTFAEGAALGAFRIPMPTIALPPMPGLAK